MLTAGLLGVVGGILAYTGRWRRWAERSVYLRYHGFSLLYFSAGIVCLGIAALFPRETRLVDTLFIVWGPLIVGGVLSFAWMPSFLLPKWFRVGLEERRQDERAMHAARKAENARRRAER